MILDPWGGGGLHPPPAQYLEVVQQMPRGSSYYLHYHCASPNHSKQNSPETRLAAQSVLGGPGNARMKSSSQSPSEAPVVVVHGVWAVMASAAQVHSWLGEVEARNLKRSRIHPCICTMSTRKGGRSHFALHELLEMVLNTDRAAPLVRACSKLPCTLRGSALPSHSVGTRAAGANATDLLSDVAVSAGEALHFETAVE